MYQHFEHGRRALVAIGGMAILGACTPQPGNVYALPPQQVQLALKQLRLPPLVFGEARLDFTMVTSDPSTIVGIVGRGRDEMMRYVITLAPANAQSTRVAVKLTAAKSGPFGNMERNLAEHPATANLYTLAMEESIASTLQRRPYDLSKLYPAMAVAAAANVGAMKASVDEVAAAERKRARDNVAKAYADEAAGRRFRP